MIQDTTIIAVFVGIVSGLISGLVFYILSTKKRWSLPEKVAYLYLLIAVLVVIAGSICYFIIKAGSWAGIVG